MIKKIIGVIVAVVTFIFLFFLIGWIILTFIPDYEFNFFISLILIIILSSISKKVYRLVANLEENTETINSEPANDKLEPDEKYENLPIRVKKPMFPFKKNNQSTDSEINSNNEKGDYYE